MEMFSKDAHISEEQQSRIASLELENQQLHNELARLRLQQGSSDTTVVDLIVPTSLLSLRW